MLVNGRLVGVMTVRVWIIWRVLAVRMLLLLPLLKCQDYSAIYYHTVAGHFTKFIRKTVVQLNVDACWRSEQTAPSQPYTTDEKGENWSSPKCQKWGAGLSLWWQTVLRPRCSHRNGAVTKGSPTSRWHLQCRVVVSAERRQMHGLWTWRRKVKS